MCTSWIVSPKMYSMESTKHSFKPLALFYHRILSLTLGSHHTVECIAIDEHTLHLTSPMGFQNINGIDWIARLASYICVLNCKYSINYHVSEEITISKSTVKENKTIRTMGAHEDEGLIQRYFFLAISSNKQALFISSKR